MNTEALDTPPQSSNNGEQKLEPSHDGADTLDEIKQILQKERERL